MESQLMTTYLEMNSRSDFCPAYSPDPTLYIMESHVPLVSFYRFLYRAVGEQWRWYDRYEWSDTRLLKWLTRPEVLLFVLYVSGTPAGFIELERQNTDVEIAYFGLIDTFLGRGYGKHLLSYGIQQAWDRGVSRVWVHTCNLDGPYALPTYQKRGFGIYKVEEIPMPEKYRQSSD